MNDNYKLILETSGSVNGTVSEEINEATGAKEKNYFIEGVFTTPDVRNKNGRIYPKKIWDEEIEKYQYNIENITKEALAEWDHPPRAEVDPLEAVARIVELRYQDDGQVYGKAKILNDGSVKTSKLKSLIDEGFKIGVSSRGLGKIGKNNIVEKYKLITFDLVASPSNYGSELSGVIEGVKFNKGISEKEYIQSHLKAHVVRKKLKLKMH